MIASCTALDLLLILTWRERLTILEHVHSYTVPAAVLLELPLGTQPHAQEELGNKRRGLTGRGDDGVSAR